MLVSYSDPFGVAPSVTAAHKPLSTGQIVIRRLLTDPFDPVHIGAFDEEEDILASVYDGVVENGEVLIPPEPRAQSLYVGVVRKAADDDDVRHLGRDAAVRRTLAMDPTGFRILGIDFALDQGIVLLGNHKNWV